MQLTLVTSYSSHNIIVLARLHLVIEGFCQSLSPLKLPIGVHEFACARVLFCVPLIGHRHNKNHMHRNTHTHIHTHTHTHTHMHTHTHTHVHISVICTTLDEDTDVIFPKARRRDMHHQYTSWKCGVDMPMPSPESMVSLEILTTGAYFTHDDNDYG